ncbi:electron transfer flavoprotein subunit beta/FixA family protein [Clostridium sp.]|uniref:electron transfer flavoprotein subunit beta/FixA family protein n=1 Tax=Clostridium sp. TaxID=1506 RepID=UPI003993A1F2
MKILTCIKEVIKDVKEFDENGFIKRKGVKLRLNKNDLYAIEQALILKDGRENVNVEVLTMGNNSAESILKEAMSMGVDNGFLLSDESLAGADTIATARALADVIKEAGNFDIVILGEYASDSISGVLGGMVGEKLNYNIIQNVSKIIQVEENKITVESSIDNDIFKVQSNLPVLLTVRESKVIPRFPNYIDVLRAEKTEIKKINLNKNKNEYGYLGSDIVVKGIKEVNSKKENKTKEGIKLENKVYEGTTSELVGVLEETLKKLDII